MSRNSSGMIGNSAAYSNASESARRQLALAPIALVVAALLSIFAFRDRAPPDMRGRSETASTAVAAPVFVRATDMDADNRFAVLAAPERH